MHPNWKPGGHVQSMQMCCLLEHPRQHVCMPGIQKVQRGGTGQKLGTWASCVATCMIESRDIHIKGFLVVVVEQ